jgi:Thioredoxin domain
MAIASSHIVADVVEVSEFPDLAQRYLVRGVPKTVINDAVEFLGNVPEATFVAHIQETLA